MKRGFLMRKLQKNRVAELITEEAKESRFWITSQVTFVDWSEMKWHSRSFRPQDVTFELLKTLTSGVVYAVEFSHRNCRDFVNMEKKRTNVIPIIEDARHPAKYRMLVGMVDVIFSDVAQPDQEQRMVNKGEQVALC
ncbi:hypothetical protein AgCh_019631 [Apium graveolens]